MLGGRVADRHDLVGGPDQFGALRLVHAGNADRWVAYKLLLIDRVGQEPAHHLHAVIGGAGTGAVQVEVAPFLQIRAGAVTGEALHRLVAPHLINALQPRTPDNLRRRREALVFRAGAVRGDQTAH